jgi:putative membrane protein insertion efficiency factor
MTGSARGPVARVMLAVVSFYSRAISPAFPPRCRFEPTCSAYAAEAISAHGAARGSWLALRRLVKCAPWHRGGFDPVPPRRTSGTSTSGHSSGSAAPAPAPGAASDRSHRDPTTSPARGRSAQQEARVA